MKFHHFTHVHSNIFNSIVMQLPILMPVYHHEITTLFLSEKISPCRIYIDIVIKAYHSLSMLLDYLFWYFFPKELLILLSDFNDVIQLRLVLSETCLLFFIILCECVVILLMRILALLIILWVKKWYLTHFHILWVVLINERQVLIFPRQSIMIPRMIWTNKVIFSMSGNELK